MHSSPIFLSEDRRKKYNEMLDGNRRNNNGKIIPPGDDRGRGYIVHANLRES